MRCRLIEQAIEALLIKEAHTSEQLNYNAGVRNSLKVIKARRPLYKEFLALVEAVRWKPIAEAPRDGTTTIEVKSTNDHTHIIFFRNITSSWGWHYYRKIIELDNYPRIKALICEKAPNEQ